jgi:biopolymer transport protein ExbB/TolQ
MRRSVFSRQLSAVPFCALLLLLACCVPARAVVGLVEEQAAYSATPASEDVDTMEDINLYGVFQKAGWEMWIPVQFLLAMWLCSIAFSVNRMLTVVRAEKQTRQFENRALTALFYNRPDEVIEVARLFPRSPVARVVNESLKSVQPAVCAPRAVVSHTIEIRRGLWTLCAIGWTSPLVGLFISTVGLAKTFRGCWYAGGSGLACVSGGIADAMIWLCFSLGLAVPTLWVYKYVSFKSETLILETARLSRSITCETIRKLIHSRCQSAMISQFPKSPQFTTDPLGHRFDNHTTLRHHTAP